MERYRKECDDLHAKLRKQDEVRSSLQAKILELEPYPELLKVCLHYNYFSAVTRMTLNTSVTGFGH